MGCGLCVCMYARKPVSSGEHNPHSAAECGCHRVTWAYVSNLGIMLCVYVLLWEREKKGGSIDNPTENVEEKEEGREGSVDGWSRVSRENRVTVVIPWREQENRRHG